MKLTEAERTEVTATLERCGIGGDDLNHSLANVCQIAADSDFPSWLRGVREALPSNHAQQWAHLHGYGADATRTVLALAKHHPAKD